MHFARQWAKSRADAVCVAGNAGGGDDEALARAQRYRGAACERTCADLRSLQVSNEGDGLLVFDGSSAKRGDAVRVILVLAVREIQARYVHARSHQSLNDARRGASRADGADNF